MGAVCGIHPDCVNGERRDLGVDGAAGLVHGLYRRGDGTYLVLELIPGKFVSN